MKAVAEAPSKVIITGEHFVVHGAWALAAAVPRRVRVEVSKSDSFEALSDRFPSGSVELRPVFGVVESLAKEYKVSPNVRVSIASSIPEGAGLGSSASTMVAVAAAMSKLYRLRLRTDDVVRFSMFGEREVHGKPSGIDPTICARGGALLFRPGSRPKNVTIRGTRSLIISYSGTTRSTKSQIGRVSAMKEKFPAQFSRLTESIGDVSLEAAEKLAAGDIKGLGSLLALDHAALVSIGVSNDLLDEMVDALIRLGAYGAKLTGAGGGGSVLAVAPEAKEKSIVSGLSARGFETFRVRIPVGGVKSWLER